MASSCTPYNVNDIKTFNAQSAFITMNGITVADLGPFGYSYEGNSEESITVDENAIWVMGPHKYTGSTQVHPTSTSFRMLQRAFLDRCVFSIRVTLADEEPVGVLNFRGCMFENIEKDDNAVGEEPMWTFDWRGVDKI